MIGITNEDLVTEKIKDLNRLLKKKNVPKDEGKKLKELRRRLLNRGYANKSRVKKDDTDQALKAENDIFEEINKMSKDRNSALRHYDHNLDQLNFNLNYELEKEIKEVSNSNFVQCTFLVHNVSDYRFIFFMLSVSGQGWGKL